MGIIFPVYGPGDLGDIDAQQRAALKAQIMDVLLNDPDVQAALEPCLIQVRDLLKAKTTLPRPRPAVRPR